MLRGAALAALAIGALAGAAAAQPSAPSDETAHYEVRRGDTLYDLAAKYFVRPSDYQGVQRANGIRNPRRLQVGSDLVVPVVLLRTEPVDATVESLGGEATATIQGRPTAALARGAVLHAGDVVATGANAFVRLALPDGSHVSLPSRSRLRIGALHRVLMTGALVREFVLDAGRSEAGVVPLQRPQDRFIVRTPLSIAAVRGTEFRVAFDEEAGRAGVGVLDGVVGVAPPASPDQATAVPRSFGVSADAAGVSPPRALLPAPSLKDSARVQQAPTVSLEVEPLEGAKAYRAQIGADAGLLNPIGEVQSDQASLSFPGLADGNWFVKLTAIDSGGLEGAPQIYAFQRFLNDVSLKTPSSSVQRRDPRWRFEWASQGSGEPTYRFQLFGEAAGAPPLIDETGLREPFITVTSLPNGVYRWRVKSTLTREGQVSEVWSPLQEFRIGR